LIAPWNVLLDKAGGYPFVAAKQVQVANPASFRTRLSPMLSAQTTRSEWMEKRMEHSRALCAVSSD